MSRGVRRQERIEELSGRVGRDLATTTVLFHHHLAARLGLSATDLKCLDLLQQSELALTAGNLAARTGLTPGAITGVADRLEAAGFVERVRDPQDRRRWELRPTATHQDEIAALFAPLGQAMADLCEAYDDEELELLSGFLAEVGRIMTAQVEGLRNPAAGV